MLFLSKSIASVCLTLFWKNGLLLDGQVQLMIQLPMRLC